jgi:Phage integrase, N-terminal SAM-like domain
MTPPKQLPATLKPGTLTIAAAATRLVPALIADAGEPAAWRYIEFFTANIRNPNTRRAYARACNQFFAWCEDRGLTLTTIRPFDVATYIETLQQTHSASGVKQQLAARAAQAAHLARLGAVGRYPGCEFTSPDNLAKHILSTAIVDLFAKAQRENGSFGSWNTGSAISASSAWSRNGSRRACWKMGS